MNREKSPPTNVFKPKNKNLHILDNYPGDQDLGDSYWKHWVENPYKRKKGSIMDYTQVERVAKEVGYTRLMKVDEIIKTLRDGANLGIEGEGRWPSVQPICI